MPFWRELQDDNDAKQALKHWFPERYDDDLAKFAYWLTTGKDFESAIEKLSIELWMLFARIQPGSNRLTRTIQKFAGDFGFRSYVNDQSARANHVVYVDNIDGKTFISNLSNKILWKDSFGFGHGEFSHSYQWLAAGMSFGWGSKTAELYSRTRFRCSEGKQMYVREGPAIVLRRPSLWQWLVDSVGEKQDSAPQGWSSEHRDFVGTCFSNTYRWANSVQTLLRSHPDWFLGHYAVRRETRLNAFRDAKKESLLSQAEPRPESGKKQRAHLERVLGVKGIDGELQRQGLKEHYDRKGMLNENRTIAQGEFRIVEQSNSHLDKVVGTFHGVEQTFLKLRNEA
jgi:hypothetical protein